MSQLSVAAAMFSCIHPPVISAFPDGRPRGGDPVVSLTEEIAIVQLNASPAIDREAQGDTQHLFSAATVGHMALLHRVVHAPTTRLRAEPDHSPGPMMVEYYRQRASAGGLMITETTHPSADSRGYDGAPGLYSDAHVAAWSARHAVLSTPRVA